MTALVVSEARVPVAPYQQVPGTDLSAIGVLGQGSLDNVVENILMSGVGYTGMSAAQVGTSNIVMVQPGYLIKGGPAYALRDPFSVDCSATINSVPDAAKTAVIAIVADGQEFASGDTRTFVDASKLPADPTTPAPTVTTNTPTRILRSVVISSPRGTADVQPSPPGYNAALCLIATVVVSNTGIISVAQNGDAQITRLDQIVQLVNALVAFQATAQPILDALKSSVSSLSLQLATSLSSINQEFALLGARITALESRATGPANAGLKGVDQFVDLSQTDTSVAGYFATVYGGLRFPYGGSTEFPIAAVNPFADNLSQRGRLANLLMPDAGTKFGAQSFSFYPKTTPGGINFGNAAYAVMISGLNNGNLYLKFNTLNVFNASFNKRGYGVQRTRFGKSLTASSTTALLSNGDPNQIFGIDVGDVIYDPSWGDWRTPSLELKRANGFARDLASRDIWTQIVQTTTAAGVPAVATSYTAAGAQMIDSIVFDLMSNEIGVPASGAQVRCVATKSANGIPDVFNVLDDVTVPMHDYLNQALDGGYTTFTFKKPLLVNSGETIHFILLTAGNYSVRMTPLGIAAATRTFGVPLALTNAGWAPLTAFMEVAAAIEVCDFQGAPTVTVPLQPLGLTGGIDMIDIAVNAMVPPGASLDYQVYIGGQWITLADIGTAPHPLAGRPSNLQLQAVFSGTNSLMPIIDLAHTKAKVSRAAGTLQHDSATRTPAANVSTVTESLVIDNWDAVHHTATAKLLSGSGFATPTVPTTTVDVTQPDGSLLRTWTWSGLSLQAHKVEIAGTATDPTNSWVGRQASFAAAT